MRGRLAMVTVAVVVAAAMTIACPMLLWIMVAALPPPPYPVCALAPSSSSPSSTLSSRHRHHRHRRRPSSTTTTTTSVTLVHTTFSSIIGIVIGRSSSNDRIRRRRRQSFFGGRQKKRDYGPHTVMVSMKNSSENGNQDNDVNHDDDDDDDETIIINKDPFLLSMKELGWTEQQQNDILERLSSLGLYDKNAAAAAGSTAGPTAGGGGGGGGSHVLLTISQDLSPRHLSSMFMDDFQLEPLLAHQVRASTLRAIEILTIAMEQEETANENIAENKKKKNNDDDKPSNSILESNLVSSSASNVNGHINGEDEQQSISMQQQQPESQILMTPIPVTFDNEDDGESLTTTTTTTTATNVPAEIETLAPKQHQQKRPSFRKAIVNQVAVTRKKKGKKFAEKNSSSSTSSSRGKGSGDSSTNIEYGLPRNYKTMYPMLGEEMTNFESFMTQPSTLSQEDPIRPATAVVYVRHAQQFLGWYLYNQQQQQQRQQKEKENQHPQETNGDNEESGEDQDDDSSLQLNEISIMTIFPSKEKESASTIIDFILWLRKERNISVSYEANLLRGLTKLLKFRFATESNADTYDLDKSYGDIPIIKELRKLHRTAERKRKGAPRSSDEERKWLSWPEYLETVQQCKKYTFDLMTQNKKNGSDDDGDIPTSEKVMIATAFQKYLVLAIFSHVPDRQRTIRELELGRSFVKLENGNWCIRHTPEDYKTGGVYGTRPPMELSNQFSLDVDAFIDNWRSCLKPKTEFLFAQPKTGNPLTQDSVYQIVVRSCYNYTGKRTNPHLLRDMIVSHVRDTNASEKQLEALALYMGHSLHMQRSSYDRRTLTRKVAPAIELLNDVNNNNMT